ncbi:FMN-dependent NADH-azoreductase [Rhodothalassium salexigens]|uniref:FMN-dependent NADH-azoreductase n=1 Tax=Rhodothalassium salexigens TaxID=1086 RepID=UPI001914C8DD|nr:NAD(P)H-dependent oxidoreductase [Rhodothalassium salexigens]MBK5910428.1 FMN-dependent NADH-azoreductase [Rhodothalassium salexigens]
MTADTTPRSAPQTALVLQASVRRDASVSRPLVARAAEALRAQGLRLTERDLTAPALPYVDDAWTAANFTPAEQRTDAQRQALALSDALVAEVQAADRLVIGLPVYNFAPPAPLKSWIDHVARAGVTFRYTENGAEGLLKDKRALLVMASGGTPAGSEIDYASTYLRHMLGFLGITDVTLAAADRVLFEQDEALARARDAIDAWTADAALAA